MKKNNRLIILSLLLFLPAFAFAQISITEIMFDPKDSDASGGGEWIEVQNMGSSAVTLTEIIFFEADTNHSITADGDINLPGGGYAVISRDLNVFKSYFSNYSGLLFKASFSLNDNEKLAIKNNKEEIVTEQNSVTYTSEWGAKNDGNSLQKIGNSWVAATPTPGALNVSSGSNSANNESNNSATTSTTPGSSNSMVVGGSAWKTDPQIFPNAGADRTVLVGTEVIFMGSALGAKKEPLENTRFVWNFGDGAVKEGKNVSHVFRQPGEYIVTLDAASGDYSQGDSVLVTAVPVGLVLGQIESGADGYVEVINKSKYDIDISGFKLGSSQNVLAAFTFPKGTILRNGKSIRFSNAVTNLLISSTSPTELLYGNGTAVAKAVAFSVPTSSQTSLTSSSLPSSPKVISTYSPPKVNPKANVVAEVSSFQNEVNEKGEAPTTSDKTEIMPWLIGLVALIGLSSTAILFLRRSKNFSADPSDEYEIIE